MLDAWKEVVDDKNPNNWVLYTYAGQTYDLKVASKGGIQYSEDLIWKYLLVINENIKRIE